MGPRRIQMIIIDLTNFQVVPIKPSSSWIGTTSTAHFSQDRCNSMNHCDPRILRISTSTVHWSVGKLISLISIIGPTLIEGIWHPIQHLLHPRSWLGSNSILQRLQMCCAIRWTSYHRVSITIINMYLVKYFFLYISYIYI